jgi:AraC family transcriptional activator FtrA
MPRPPVAKTRASPTHRVVVLAYDGLCTFEFGIAVEMFGLPRPEFRNWYSFAVCSVEKKAVTAVGGIRISTSGGLELLEKANTIVIPGWKKPYQPPSKSLIRALAAAHERGARLVSICVGSFVLGALGVLDGKRATTHWRFVDEMSTRFPRVTVQPDVLYVDEGNVLTSAGSAAGIDLCLHVIRKDYGTVVANQVARRAVVPPHREGGQAQFIEKPVGDAAHPWLSHLLAWSNKNLHTRLSIDGMANEVHTSKRTLCRRFRETTGMSPLEWVTRLRVRRAKDLLETTTLSIEELAQQCGFGSAAVLRHHFRARVQLSPIVYRERFDRRSLGKR